MQQQESSKDYLQRKPMQKEKVPEHSQKKLPQIFSKTEMQLSTVDLQKV